MAKLTERGYYCTRKHFLVKSLAEMLQCIQSVFLSNQVWTKVTDRLCGWVWKVKVVWTCTILGTL